MTQRTILFRGKNQSGEWVYGSYVAGIFDDYGHIISNCTHSDYEQGELSLNGANVVSSSTVGQFTGQLDLDEKKVFEGDKVSAYGGNIFNVVFYKSAFQLEQAKTKVIVPFSTFDGNFEVIGTIHDK